MIRYTVSRTNTNEQRKGGNVKWAERRVAERLAQTIRADDPSKWQRRCLEWRLVPASDTPTCWRYLLAPPLTECFRDSRVAAAPLPIAVYTLAIALLFSPQIDNTYTSTGHVNTLRHLTLWPPLVLASHSASPIARSLSTERSGVPVSAGH